MYVKVSAIIVKPQKLINAIEFSSKILVAYQK